MMFMPVTNYKRSLSGSACLYLPLGEGVISMPRKLLTSIDKSKTMIVDKEWQQHL